MEYDQEEAQWSEQEEVPPSEQEEVPPSEQEEEEEASSSMSLRPPSTNDTYLTLSAILKAVNQHGKDQGYALVKRRTKQKKGAIHAAYLRCDKGGKRRERLPLRDSKRRRKTSTRMTDCPFEAVARLQEGVWILDVKKPAHNHWAISAIGHLIHRKEAVTSVPKPPPGEPPGTSTDGV
ncbi:MAG: hypothetical protein FRX48_06254 [Lasallia pustulata]|uniref:FAR1 domain-containing protein n=1 Tax=Lasallia pustulata TaxID=136370 RepID=A0A5M8PL68_9LECA|nr:MAG: hypothetical protein FRX48_06254 [Lasallia pustulata]